MDFNEDAIDGDPDTATILRLKAKERGRVAARFTFRFKRDLSKWRSGKWQGDQQVVSLSQRARTDSCSEMSV